MKEKFLCILKSKWYNVERLLALKKRQRKLVSSLKNRAVNKKPKNLKSEKMSR